jgi:hypothetical protein
MAGLVEIWSNIEVHSVIRFLRLKGTSPAKIHRQLVEVSCCEEASYCCTITPGHTQPTARVSYGSTIGRYWTILSTALTWHRVFFISLDIEEAPGWKAIRNRRRSSASRPVLASGVWHWFLLLWDRCLGVPVGQMLRQVWGYVEK